MSDLQIQKAQCLCDLTDALPHYRKQLDRIDVRLTDYIADAISDQAAHANIYELLGIRKAVPFDVDCIVPREFSDMYRENPSE